MTDDSIVDDRDDSPVDYKSAPADYEELHRRYHTYVVNLVASQGIAQSSAEDVAADIMLRFLERDMLSKFDPDLVFNHDGVRRPARFKTFLTKVVLRYVKGHRDKQARRASHELAIMDMPFDGGAGAPGDSHGSQETWGEVYGPPEPSAEDEVLAWLSHTEVLADLRAHIATVPRRSKFDTCDLLALFDEMIRQIERDDAWNVTELRALFGVSATAIHTWMWWLRENIADHLGIPLPPKRPRPKKVAPPADEATP